MMTFPLTSNMNTADAVIPHAAGSAAGGAAKCECEPGACRRGKEVVREERRGVPVEEHGPAHRDEGVVDQVDQLFDAFALLRRAQQDEPHDRKVLDVVRGEEARRERGEAGEQVEGELGLLEAREDVLLDRLVHDAADLPSAERL